MILFNNHITWKLARAAFGIAVFICLNAHLLKAAVPTWSVTPEDYEFSMTITALIDIQGTPSDDSNDLLAAFVNGEVRGVGSPDVFVASANQYMVFLQVYGDVSGEDITFQYYDHSEDIEYMAINAPIDFVIDGVVGSTSDPIFVTANHFPTAMNLSNSSIAENQSLGTPVGTFSTTDNNATDTHTYAFVSGDGDDDNAVFAIDGDELQSNSSFNFESKDNYTIRVKVTDSQGGTYEQSFEISITDGNDGPTAIQLSNTSINENESNTALIGSLSTTDEDGNDSHTYTFSTFGGNGADNDAFDLDGSNLKAKSSYNYEVQHSYSIQIQSRDQDDASVLQTFTISIVDVNDTPDSLQLSSTELTENSEVGTVVGDFTTFDQDTFDTHTYTFFDPSITNDNASFTISGNQLVSFEVFNREEKDSYTIYVRSTDGAGTSVDKTLTIAITDSNDVPHTLELSSLTIDENLKDSTTIGSFSATDEDLDALTYTLVSGEGDEDNSAFFIDGAALKSAERFDFEKKSLYTIRVQVDDGRGGQVEAQFEISINDQNDAPTSLSLTPAVVNENLPISSSVGVILVADQDDADNHVFALVAGTGDEHNDLFSISGDELITDTIFDFETQDTFAIRLQVDDQHGGTYEQAFTIHIQDDNDAPTAIILSSDSVFENQPSFSIVSNLSAADQDVADSHSFTIVGGSGQTAFVIESRVLKTNQAFNFEENASYSLILEAKDQAGAVVVETHIIRIIDQNDAPTNLALNSSTVDENSGANAFIGIISATDQDDGQSLTYALVAGSGDTDNSLFYIQEDSLFAQNNFDFESRATYQIRIQAADGNGSTLASTFTISINDLNDAPTNLSLSATTIDENQATGFAIGTFDVDDEDDLDNHNFTLVSGIGDDHNDQFSIINNELQSNSSFDFETQASFKIRVQADDSRGGVVMDTFTIQINDVNDAPTAISLSADSVFENQGTGTTVGVFSSTDQDDGDAHTYQITGGTGQSLFSLDGNTLKTAASLNFEEQADYTLTISTTDVAKATFSQSFTIRVIDANDAPTALSLSAQSVAENAAALTVIGLLSTVDEDVNDTHTYRLSNLNGGGADNGAFILVEDTLKALNPFDFEVQENYTIQLTTEDGASGSFTQDFTIEVRNVNEAPTGIRISIDSIFENQPASTVIGQLSAEDQDNGDLHTFTIVGGTGQSAFIIESNVLKSSQVFDFETTSEYTLLIEAKDANNATFTETLTIRIIDENEIPSNLSLSSATIDENSGANAFVGIVSAIDQDDNQALVYALVAGTGDTDNNSFLIREDSLFAINDLNFESQGTYQIRIAVDDQNGSIFADFFTIQVNDLNDMPTNLALSSLSINENEGANTTVGSFSVNDEDDSDSHNFTLVSGIGDDHNDQFSIINNELQSNSSFDFETQASFKIRVQADDSRGGVVMDTFTIQINDVNDVPTAISLSADSVFENQGTGTTVGVFSSTDQDDGDAHTYQITGGTGQSLFSLDGNTLKTAASLNFEEQADYTLTISTTDVAKATFSQSFTIRVIDANDAPTALSLSAQSVAENAAALTVIGLLSTVDEDVNDTHTYRFSTLNGGGADNGAFILVEDTLKALNPFDFEVQEDYVIQITTDDGASGSFTQDFTIEVRNVNEAPTGIRISIDSIFENQPASTVIGQLAAEDQDNGDLHTFTIIGGTGQSAFVIESNVLKSSQVFDFETTSEYTLLIEAKDANNATFTETLTIRIIDENETPSNLSLSSTTIDENSGANAFVGIVSAIDQDDNQALVYALVAGTGDTDNNSFLIREDSLFAINDLNFESQGTYRIRIAVDDQNGSIFADFFTIQVNDLNDMPTNLALSSLSINENEGANTTVGSFSVNDEDASDTHQYSLVAGTGDEGNAQFVIVNNLLQTRASFDFETQASFNIRVKADDQQGGTIENTFLIQVQDLNDAPTDLSLSNELIAENQPTQTVVALLTTSDQDVGEMHTYRIIGGTGQTVFSIHEDTIKTAEVLNYEVQSSYTLNIETRDAAGETFSSTFTIRVTDENDIPTELALSNTSIPENEAALAVIGVLSTVDEDVNDTHNYRFSNLNGGGVDNGAFILVEDTLKALNPFDFEVQEDYVIQITTDDGASGSFTQDFTIEVRNVNEQADALFLSSDSILENSPIGAIVGILSVNDQDQNDTHTYQIIGGTGQTAFSIDGSLIKANQVVNFEETTSYTLIIEVRDGGGANFSETFTIRVIDVNEAPTAIVLTNINLFDNLPINSSIAQLETEDEDMADSHTYTLVSGTGDIHNSQFTLAGNLLRNNEVIDFEVISEYFIRVQVEDENGNQLEQALSLSAVNVNDPPTDLSLSNLTIAENQPSSSVVGVFSVVDQDTQDSHTYELIAGVGGEDNGDFSIVGNVLQANSSLDYESDSTRNILVEVTDNEGASYSEAFVIKVSDINESPISNDVTFEVEEHTIDGTSVGTITASDVDLNQTLTFEVMDTEEELAFAIDAATGELTVNQEALLDYEVTPTFTFEVIVSDNGTPALKDTARVIINLIDLLETDLPVTNFVSPNDDGHNDTWAIQNVAQYSGYELVIYDANGLEVYRASEYNNEWAGQSTDGRELPQGTYFYRFMKSGAAINYKGSITLVR